MCTCFPRLCDLSTKVAAESGDTADLADISAAFSACCAERRSPRGMRAMTAHACTCRTLVSPDVDACAEPCNLRGVCQTNNTCACTNGYRTCRPQSGTLTSATAGCETNIYTDNNNCGACGNVRCCCCPSFDLRSHQLHCCLPPACDLWQAQQHALPPLPWSTDNSNSMYACHRCNLALWNLVPLACTPEGSRVMGLPLSSARAAGNTPPIA